MQYSVENVCRIMKGALVQQTGNPEIAHLLLDSRKLAYPASSLFIPVVSERRNGHRYIGELYEKGVSNFVISEEIPLPPFPRANFIRVKDTVQALQALAAHHRRQFSIPVIGITGSNGKTIVKEWLFQLLEADYHIVRSPKSYNSQTGVPLSVWQMEPGHQLAIFEAGISQPGEMVNLEKIIRPTAGIFTNIGEAHNEGFLNIRQKINEKLVLFTHSESLIYCKDYPELNECILQFHANVRKRDEEEGHSLRLFSWSRKSDADLKIISIDQNNDHTRIDALYQGSPLSVSIPFTDEGSVENAVNCWCVLLLMEVPEPEIRRRMERLGHVAMRLELKQAINNCSLINDSYNSDLGSLRIALDFLQRQKQHPGKTLILSDILQSGKNEAELYEEVARLLEQKNIGRFIGIGRNISRAKNIFLANTSLKCSFFHSTDEFILQFRASQFRDETILLKGARVFEFERIGRLLERKIHQTVLEINLTAVAHNLRQYQLFLKPATKIMAMVKAFSYGSGSFEIANLLQFMGVDYLAVAYADEGVELRRNGITMPVMVMDPEPGTFDAIIQWKLEPEIYSLQLLRQFGEALKKAGAERYSVHIKLDTGMHRLGFEPGDVGELLKALENNPGMHVASVFSHLAASDEPQFDDFTRQQGTLFRQMSDTLVKGLGYPVIRHIANSAAIHRHPDLQFDMVRLGIGLYGVDASAGIMGKLRNVSRLKTTVSQVKKIPAGETIGYGRAGQAGSGKIIATVSIGYADGYMRRLGNGKGKMMVGGQLAPVIGNVCMDMLMLDITDIPGVKEGDEVIVFGDLLPVQTVARWAETIPYEIMTGISQRVKRVYFEE